MKYFFLHKSGFTLVELLVVITIVSFLMVLAVTDYAFASKRARLQIGTEQLVAFLDEARVNTQSGPYCYAVSLNSSKPPEQWEMEWDAEAEQCVLGSIVSRSTLLWPAALSVNELTWDVMLSGNPSTHQASNVLLVFVPPRGEIQMHQTVNDPAEAGVQTIWLHVSYNDPSNASLNKTVKIVPVTGTFDII